MPTVHAESSPPAGAIRGLARILPFAGRDVYGLIAGMAISLISSALALGIPIALEALVDGPLRGDDPALVWPAVGLIALLGLFEALFIYLRRVAVLTPGTRIDSRIRNAIYDHLQNLPVAFHDKWQSGQLLSRAHTDVSLLRRWLSYGAVMLVGNSIAIVLGVAILFTWSPILAILFLICSIPMFVFGSRFRNRFTGLSRAAQDQWGDVATSVEESVHGIRVLRSFGRGDDSLSAQRTGETSKSPKATRERRSVFGWSGFPILRWRLACSSACGSRARAT